MSGYEDELFEIDPGHAERLTEDTDRRLRQEIENLLNRFGAERDSEIWRLSEEAQQSFLPTLQRWGITEETPIVRQASLPVKKPRLLPDYLHDDEDQAVIVCIKSLIDVMPFEYKVCYGAGSNLHGRWLLEGLEVNFYPTRSGTRTAVRSRDPATREIAHTHLTEAQGQDMLKDLGELLEER